MAILRTVVVAVAILVLPMTPSLSAQDSGSSAVPPIAGRQDHRIERHGQVEVDPYYWLRDKQDPKVISYLQAENAYTSRVTAPLQPLADRIYQEMLSRVKQTDLSVSVQRGQYLYYSRFEDGQQYPIYCRRPIGSDQSPEQVLLDVNALSTGHKFVGIGDQVVSEDGKFLAYTVDFTGFRQYQLQIKNLQTGQTLADSVPRVTSVEWAADNRTLLLTTEDAVTKRSDTLLRHHVGAQTPETVYHEADELYDVHLDKTRDRQYLVLTISSKDTTEQRFLAASAPEKQLETFLPRQKGHRYYIDHRNDLFYMRTNHDGVKPGGAKDFRVVTATLAARDPGQWKTFVPYQPGTLLDDFELFSSFAVLQQKHNAADSIRIYRFDTNAQGQWSEIPAPEPVCHLRLGSTPEFTATKLRYSFESFTTPQTIFDFDVNTGKSQLLKQQEVPGGYDPGRYQSERIWATARDGVKVPISIVYKRGLVRDGSAPLLLYGYGSYGIGMTPNFSSSRVSLLDRGVVYAIAHIRGGNELGEQWREDGMLMKKKNTFNDFVDSAQALIQEKWTNPSRLVIEGGSAGGLLMGAVVNQRPDLFRAVHLAVPFVDVINTMSDPSLPLTVGEYLEWGNPEEEAAFRYMRSYSPYDNLEKRSYPSMLVTTSLNDSQVMYWEPAKYVARLRTVKTDQNPLLLKVKMDPAGHGGASGRYDRLRDLSFEYAWMLDQVGIHN